MSDNRHYEALTAKPARESMYGFLLMGIAISDTELKPAPWWGQIKITQDTAPAEKAYCERWNPILAVFDNGFRKQAIEGLRLAGVPEARLFSPLSTEVEALIRDLTNGYRLELKYLQERCTNDILKRSLPFDGERFSRELCARVIVAAGHALGSPGHEATAKYLNGGLPPGEKGLTRDHVGRATKSHDKMLERLIKATWRSPLATPASLAQLTFADIELVHHLDTVYRHARARPEFKRLRGVDLALAIHAQFDLNQRLHRAAGLPRAKLTAA